MIRAGFTVLNDERLYDKEEMAGVPGFEPGMPIPKTGALPLGYTPTILMFNVPKIAKTFNHMILTQFKNVKLGKWCRNQDSNPGPDDYKTDFAPIEPIWA